MNRYAIVALAIVAISAIGCTDRRIYVTSEPCGARVYLNDVDVGVTPLETNFTYFGTYDVRVRKDGYEPLVTQAEADAPWHEQPGLDLVAAAIPGEERTEVRWHFVLEPADADVGGLLERAAALRGRAVQQVVDERAPDAQGG